MWLGDLPLHLLQLRSRTMPLAERGQHNATSVRPEPLAETQMGVTEWLCSTGLAYNSKGTLAENLLVFLLKLKMFRGDSDAAVLNNCNTIK